ncbi:MAG: Pimeloyl-[acyl-carrier protein] methyl ester esterase [Xanthomonadaceae bacterium]|nr:Pimeloyl-[acyl-carrier protein] methyl ester esterase [Xanthomonadaceae bacterium]
MRSGIRIALSAGMSGLHIQVTGTGPPLVLLHGWAMHGGVFGPLVARLRDRFTLHVVDLPGHGFSRDSGVPMTLAACADAIAAQVPLAPWCGWSLGGLVALHAASRAATPVTRLAMVCASPRFVRSGDHGDPWPYAVSAEVFSDFADGLRSDYRGTLERFVALEAFGSDHAKDEMRALRDDLLTRGAPTADVLADGLRVLQTADLRAAVQGLTMPSLWLAGRRDRLVDPRAMQAAAAMAPRARFHVVEHAGHAPFLTHADAVATQLVSFLDDDTSGVDA